MILGLFIFCLLHVTLLLASAPFNHHFQQKRPRKLRKEKKMVLGLPVVSIDPQNHLLLPTFHQMQPSALETFSFELFFGSKSKESLVGMDLLEAIRRKLAESLNLSRTSKALTVKATPDFPMPFLFEAINLPRKLSLLFHLAKKHKHHDGHISYTYTNVATLIMHDDHKVVESAQYPVHCSTFSEEYFREAMSIYARIPECRTILGVLSKNWEIMKDLGLEAALFVRYIHKYVNLLYLSISHEMKDADFAKCEEAKNIWMELHGTLMPRLPAESLKSIEKLVFNYAFRMRQVYILRLSPNAAKFTRVKNGHIYFNLPDDSKGFPQHIILTMSNDHADLIENLMAYFWLKNKLLSIDIKFECVYRSDKHFEDADGRWSKTYVFQSNPEKFKVSRRIIKKMFADYKATTRS